jgi:acetyl esterase/lipase
MTSQLHAADAPNKDATRLDPIPLWPGIAPGDKLDMPPEKVTPNKDNVAIMANVSKPMITVYKPAADKNTGAAVIVCPGGGYSILAYDLEGTEVCDWLNSIGVTGVLLKYRVPGRGEHNYSAPLQDAQRAIGMVRAHAKEWNIDPNRIAILGFSAGGHLAAAASNIYDTRTYPTVDDSDKESCKPDFTILIYPAYLTDKKDFTKLAPELKVNAQTPPAFMTMAEDDPVHVENIYTYSQALKANKVRAEVHVFPTGGHGYGLRPGKNPISTAWPRLAGEWMKAQGFLTQK